MKIHYIESSTTPGVFYRVDAERGECTCEAGKHARRCRHLAAVLDQLKAAAGTMGADIENEMRRGQLHAALADLIDEHGLEDVEWALDVCREDIDDSAIQDGLCVSCGRKPADDGSCGCAMIAANRGWHDDVSRGGDRK